MTKLVFRYILRDKIKYEIIVILFISVFSSINSPQNLYGLNFCTTLLGILFILYFSVMNAHKSKFLLLYQPRNVIHLRKDTIKSLCYLSSIFLVLSVILDIFVLKSLYLTEYYLLSMVIFYISTSIVRVNIEKNTRIDEPIIKLKECFIILLIALGLMVIIFAAKILVFSNLLQ
ncbi:hypothetical protein AAA072_04285 [Finegoldia magna]|uniref:hypothetical protein n=1 Tax=Finegoldia magna TaxID=1260 RepID=UPI0032C1684E